MSEKILFPIDVVVGKYYLVPHIFTMEFGGVRHIYLPVSTPMHDDIEIIKFTAKHWHIDWRFVSNRIYKRIIDSDREVFEQVKNVIVEKETDYYTTHQAIDNTVKYLTRKCVRKPLANVFHNVEKIKYYSWPYNLQKAYCGEHLRKNEFGQYVCPHKGAIIDLKYVDENGHAVCPAHLLKFNTETLLAI